MPEPDEQWVPVVGYEALYEVSDLGRVRSFDRVASNGSHRKGRVLTPTGIRYLHVTLSLGAGVKVQQAVHRLVLEAFTGACPAGMEALHRDDDPTNNGLSNLRWGTHIENTVDKISNGGQQRGERVNTAKLTPSLVVAIRERAQGGESARQIARSFGLNQSTISKILAGRTWRHV